MLMLCLHITHDATFILDETVFLCPLLLKYSVLFFWPALLHFAFVNQVLFRKQAVSHKTCLISTVSWLSTSVSYKHFPWMFLSNRIHNSKKYTHKITVHRQNITEQTSSLIWNCKLSTSCDSWTFPLASNANRSTLMKNAIVAGGGFILFEVPVARTLTTPRMVLFQIDKSSTKQFNSCVLWSQHISCLVMGQIKHDRELSQCCYMSQRFFRWKTSQKCIQEHLIGYILRICILIYSANIVIEQCWKCAFNCIYLHVMDHKEHWQSAGCASLLQRLKSGVDRSWGLGGHAFQEIMQ
jgi:hypothetical protein